MIKISDCIIVRDKSGGIHLNPSKGLNESIDKEALEELKERFESQYGEIREEIWQKYRRQLFEMETLIDKCGLGKGKGCVHDECNMRGIK